MTTEKNANNGATFRTPAAPKTARPLADMECPASEAITFHLVRSVEEVPTEIRGAGGRGGGGGKGGRGAPESSASKGKSNYGKTFKAGGDPLSFHPALTHQLFGEEEKIYGYKGLQVDIWIHRFTFHAFVHMKYDSIVQPRGRRRKADNVLGTLKENFPGGLFEDWEAFAKAVAVFDLANVLSQGVQVEKGVKSGGFISARPPTGGQVPPTDNPRGSSEGAPSYEILRFDFEKETVVEWHRRMEPLVLFFIDGSSLIDTRDKRWEMLVAVERTADGALSRLCVQGFTTMYSFYHYPDSTRLRLSQLLVLPPFQGQGYGRAMLNAVNKLSISRGCYDVTVEDPTDEFQWMLDVEDVERLMALPEVAKSVEEAINRAKNMASKKPANGPRRTLLGIPTHLWEEVRSKLKISRKQFRRCWEVAMYVHTSMKDSKMREPFRQLVTSRLRAEHFGVNRPSEKDKRKRTVVTGMHEDLPMFFMMSAPKRRRLSTDRTENGGGSAKKGAHKGGAGSSSSSQKDRSSDAVNEDGSGQTQEEKDVEQMKALEELFQDRLEEIRIIEDKLERYRLRLRGDVTLS
ncbi:hypothetical protein CBR_g45363 [Chara braunii]|uniref:histone acetyltransferase n=1 Tax=Chara braunii TaxID=69332 RepID=A0A388LYG2_CHABU|nr:hypothetical protein CBR_g45363 [Chara braunii]|eukprot:GBG87303.1 hypothetical protein CBR_g45363 [Chara braunii]